MALRRSLFDVISSCRQQPGRDLLDEIADVCAGAPVDAAERYAAVSSTPDLDIARVLLATVGPQGSGAAALLARVPASLPCLAAPRTPPLPRRVVRQRLDLDHFVASFSHEASVRGAFARGFTAVPGGVSSRDHAGVCVAALVFGAVGTEMPTAATLRELDSQLSQWRRAATGTAAWVYDVCVWFDRNDADVASTLQFLAAHHQFVRPVSMPDVAALTHGAHLRAFKLPPVISLPPSEAAVAWARHLAEPAAALRLSPFMSFDECFAAATRPVPLWDHEYAVAVARLCGRVDVIRSLNDPSFDAPASTRASAGLLLLLAEAARASCAPSPGGVFAGGCGVGATPTGAPTCAPREPSWVAYAPGSLPGAIAPTVVSRIAATMEGYETRLRVPYERADLAAGVAAARPLVAARSPRTSTIAAVLRALGRATPTMIAQVLHAVGDEPDDNTVRSALSRLTADRRATYVTYGLYGPGMEEDRPPAPRATVSVDLDRVPPPGGSLAAAVRAVVDIEPSIAGPQVVAVLRARGWSTSSQYVAAPLRRYRSSAAHASSAPAPQRNASTSTRSRTATTSSGPLATRAADHFPSVV